MCPVLCLTVFYSTREVEGDWGGGGLLLTREDYYISIWIDLLHLKTTHSIMKMYASEVMLPVFLFTGY